MSDVSVQLKSRGWQLTTAGIETISNQADAAGRDVGALERVALHFDLSDIGAKWLHEATNRARIDGHLEGTYVLQVSKVKLPSSNPRDVTEPQCKVFLTDGAWSCAATLTEVTNKLMTELVVGTKVQLFGVVRFESGSTTLHLSATNMRVLGGSTRLSADHEGNASRHSRPVNGEQHADTPSVDSNVNAAPAKQRSDRPDNVDSSTSDRPRPDYDRRYESERPYRGRGAYRGYLRNLPHFPQRSTPPNGDRFERPPASGRERFERSSDRPADREREWNSERDRERDAEVAERERDRDRERPPRSTVWDFLPQTLKDDANAKRNARGHPQHPSTTSTNPQPASDSPRSATPSSGGQREATDADVDTTSSHRDNANSQPPVRGNWRRSAPGAPVSAWQSSRGSKRTTRDSQSSATSAGPPNARSQNQDRRSFNASGTQPASGVDEQAKLPPRLTRQKQAEGANASDSSATAGSTREASDEHTQANNYQHHQSYGYSHHSGYHSRFYHNNDDGYRGNPRGRGMARGAPRGYNYSRGAPRSYPYYSSYYYGSQNTTPANAANLSTPTAGAGPVAASGTDTSSSQSQSQSQTQPDNASRDSPSRPSTANLPDHTTASQKDEDDVVETETEPQSALNVTDDEKHGTVGNVQPDNTELQHAPVSNPQPQLQTQTQPLSQPQPQQQPQIQSQQIATPAVQQHAGQQAPPPATFPAPPLNVQPPTVATSQPLFAPAQPGVGLVTQPSLATQVGLNSAGLAAMMAPGAFAQPTVNLGMMTPQQTVANLAGMNMGVGVQLGAANARSPQPSTPSMFARTPFGMLPSLYNGPGIPFIPPGMLGQRLNPAFLQPLITMPGQQFSMFNMFPNQYNLHSLQNNVVHHPNSASNPANNQHGNNLQHASQASLPPNSVPRGTAPQNAVAAPQQTVNVRATRQPSTANGQRTTGNAQQEGLLGSAPNRAPSAHTLPQTTPGTPMPEAQAYQPQLSLSASGNAQSIQRSMQSLSVAPSANNAASSPSPKQSQPLILAQSAQTLHDAPASGNYVSGKQHSQADVASNNVQRTATQASVNAQTAQPTTSAQANAQVIATLPADVETQITAVYQNYLAVYRLNQTVRARVLGKQDTPSVSASVSDEQATGNGAARFVKAVIRRIDTANKSLLVVLSEGEQAGTEQWTSLTDVRPHYDKPPELSAYRTAEQQKAHAPSQSSETAANPSPSVSVPNTPATNLTSPFSTSFNHVQPPYTSQNSTGSGTFASSATQVPFGAPSQNVTPTYVSSSVAPFAAQPPILFVGGQQTMAPDAGLQQPPTPSYSNPINLNLSMNLGLTILGNQPQMFSGSPQMQMQMHPQHNASIPPMGNPGNVLLTGPPFGAFVKNNLPATMNVPVSVAAQFVAAQHHANMSPFGAPPINAPDDGRSQMMTKFEPHRN